MPWSTRASATGIEELVAEDGAAELILQDDGVLLRPWHVDDAAWYVASRDATIFRWTTEDPTLTTADAAAAIVRVHEREDLLSFAIADADSGALLGNLALVRDDADRSRGEVMYWLAPAGRGRGAATRAVRLLCRWAFAALGLCEITLQTHKDNLPSQRVAERTGFRQTNPQKEEPVQSDHLWFVLRHTEPDQGDLL